MKKKIKILVSFNLKPEFLKKIRKVSKNIYVEFTSTPEEVVEKIGDAEILFAGKFSSEIFIKGKNLKWIQGTSAGIERFLFPEFVKSPIPLTCARTVYDIPVSEHTLALMLALSRQLNPSIRNQLKREWTRPVGTELHGKILGIVGYGSIGICLTKLLKPFGMKVIGWKRTPLKDPSPADEIWTGKKLGKLFSISDYIVIVLPKTLQTTGLVNWKLLSRMKPSAYLINVGRGNALNEKDLVKALKMKKLAGAGLDVFQTEPLPKSSPFWKISNLTISPHIGGYSPESDARMINLFCENLRRYLNKNPLLHLVNKKLGY